MPFRAFGPQNYKNFLLYAIDNAPLDQDFNLKFNPKENIV